MTTSLNNTSTSIQTQQQEARLLAGVHEERERPPGDSCCAAYACFLIASFCVVWGHSTTLSSEEGRCDDFVLEFIRVQPLLQFVELQCVY